MCVLVLYLCMCVACVWFVCELCVYVCVCVEFLCVCDLCVFVFMCQCVCFMHTLFPLHAPLPCSSSTCLVITLLSISMLGIVL